jgi:hypothetical protein
MTSKHSTGGGHGRSVGRAGGLGEPERRAGERDQNPPDDSARKGNTSQDAGTQEQSAEGDRKAGGASRQQGGDRG